MISLSRNKAYVLEYINDLHKKKKEKKDRPHFLLLSLTHHIYFKHEMIIGLCPVKGNLFHHPPLQNGTKLQYKMYLHISACPSIL